MKAEDFNGVEVIAFDDAAEWEDWLSRHHERDGGVWLKIAKKGAGETTVKISEALDVALCYGWIDSQRKGYDDKFYLQRYSRRRPNAVWSQVNVEKVEALIAAGRMRPPGFEEIAKAKEDGRWDAAYEAQRNAKVPPDLEAALAENEKARARYESLGKTDRYMVIFRLATAKTAENRAARLQRMIAALEAGEAIR